jgi:SAM-dependent methyltransferase
MSSEEIQRSHFNRIASDYAAHYGDPWSRRYRRRFINDPLTRGIDLEGKLVLEGMCGSGEITDYLLERGARVIGLDISEREVETFRARWPQCDAQCASITQTGLSNGSLDAVFVVGGLHHVHPHVAAAIEEIWRVLKPGGYFCFAEPHRGSLPDGVRRLWYRRDRYFASNEESIDVEELKERFGGKFEFRSQLYQGGIAYQFVLNSLIWRIPLWLKPYYSPALLWVEGFARNGLPRSLACFVVSQWRKRGE